MYITENYYKSPSYESQQFIHVLPPTIQDKFEELGHRIVGGSKGIKKCIKCGETYTHKAMKQALEAKHVCQGDSHPLVIQTTHRNKPINTCNGHDIYFAGAKIHHSHCLRSHAGHIYCTKCGSYASLRVKKLKDECTRKLSRNGHNVIRSILSIEADLPGQQDQQL